MRSAGTLPRPRRSRLRGLADGELSPEGAWTRFNEVKGTRKPEREDFSQIRTTLPIPNLIDVQRRSYERFLQMNLLPEERASHGLQAVFTSIFPFSDFRETCSLDFVKYTDRRLAV